MTDIHCHILYDVDDGSVSIEESLELLKAMKEVGFNNIIMTPHYIENTNYCSLNNEKLTKLNILREEVKKHNIDINLYLGNEIFINDHIVEGIKKNEIYTLNGTRYLLFELPFHNRILNLMDIVYEIKVAGFIPILAHPERYDHFQDNYKYVDELKDEGLLFQCNFSSIIGAYGKHSEKLMKYMLKKGYVDYLGTDLHHLKKGTVLEEFPKINKKILKYAGKDYYEEILNNNEALLKEESIYH